jgi:hypothetical protein
MDTTYCVCSLEILSATKDLERLKKAEEEAQSHVLFGRRLLLGTLSFVSPLSNRREVFNGRW